MLTETETFHITRRRAAKNDWVAVEGDHETRGRVSVSGVFIPSIPAHMTFEGTWSDHPRFGPQFKVSRVIDDLESDEGIIAFLMQLPNLGRQRAKDLLTQCGGREALTCILDEGAVDMLTKVNGVTLARADAIIEHYGKVAGDKELFEFCGRLHLSSNLTKKIKSEWGKDGVAILREDIYRLREIRNVGFAIADGAAIKLRIFANDPRCLKATCDYLLECEEREGHVWTPIEQLVRSRHAEKCRAAASDLIVYLNDSSTHVLVKDGQVASFELAEAEAYVSDKLSIELARDWEVLDVPQSALDGEFELHADQIAGLHMVAQKGISIVTGGPGVGKTLLTKRIIEVFEHEGLDVSLCAPTGKAALRMSEQCGGREASTIHRLLKYHPQLGFRHSDQSASYDGEHWITGGQLNTDVVIVDEFSMVDMKLFRALLCGLKPGTRIVMVGDVDQLPSIGAGQVLKDFIDSTVVPVCRLTKIFRQAEDSAIPWLAKDINEGRTPCTDTGASDVQGIWNETTQAVVDAATAHGLNGCQVISPQYAGDLGVDALNSALQKYYQGDVIEQPHIFIGKSPKATESARAVVGDKIINKKNQYELDDVVYNGEVGTVVKVDYGSKKAAITVRFSDDKVVDFPRTNATDLQLGYCITGHAYQGSQAATVIVALSAQHQFMLTRKWTYTAVTRAARLLILVGNKDMLSRAARNTRGAVRRTRLSLTM